MPANVAEISPDGVVVEANAPTAGEEAKPPVAEVITAEVIPNEGGDDITLDAFEIAKHSVSKDELAQKKPAEIRKEAEVKPNDIKPPLQQQSRNPSRALDDIDEEDKEIFTRMSNAAHDKLKPIYLEHKKLKQETESATKKLAEQEELIKQLRSGTHVPESYYEHDSAYVLTPAFNAASNAVSMAELVKNHWQEQLSNVLGGEKTYVPLVKDQQTGQIHYGQPAAIDQRTEQVLRNNLSFALEQVGARRAALDNIAQTHKAKVGESKTWLNGWEKATFPNFDKPEAKELAEEAKDLMGKFPAALQANPLLNALAKSLVLNTRFSQALQAKAAPKAQVKPTVKKAPSLAEMNGDGGEGKGNEGEVTFDDFNKIKEGVL